MRHGANHDQSITPFNFHGHDVRVITADNGEPRFVLKDLCTVLEIGNARQVRARLDSDGVSQADVIDSMGRTQSATVVDEAGMYEVVLRSDKPEAAEFRRWVTREVLPAIREHGGYLTPDKAEQILTDPDTIIRLATDLKEERARREVAEKRGDTLARHRQAIEGGDGISVTDFGKKYFSETPAKQFQAHLYDHGWQIKQLNTREMPDGKCKNGHDHGKPTAKGRPYIYNHDGGNYGGRRRFTPRVRPQMEVEFRDRLAAEGLAPNEHSTGLVLICNDELREIGA